MDKDDLWSPSGTKKARLIRERKASASEIASSVLKRIEDVDPTASAYCTLSEWASSDARAADQALQGGRDLGPLHGLPVSVKDIGQTEMQALYARALAMFVSAFGFTVDKVDLGVPNVAASFWALVTANTDLRGLRRIRQEQPDDLTQSLRSLLATQWSADDFTDAAMVCQEISNTMWHFTDRYDLLLTPTTTLAAKYRSSRYKFF